MKQGGNSTILSAAVAGNGAGLAILDVPVHKEEVDSKLDAAREQLLTLRRQQEELEQQKADLEELRRKQDEYARGKAEMIDHITRALVTLDREQIQAQRLSELCENTTTAFKDYLDQLQAINDESWSSSNIRAELSRALGVIENSRLEYNRARTKLDCLNPVAGQPTLPVEKPVEGLDWNETLRYVRLGAAASAPLILAGTIWVILLLTLKH
jgi:DNA repair exonuclease SbcCD ATPase subunit